MLGASHKDAPTTRSPRHLGFRNLSPNRGQCPVEACRSRADSLMAIYTHAEGFVGDSFNGTSSRQSKQASAVSERKPGDDTCPRDGEPHKEQWSCLPTGAPPGGWLIPAWGPDDDETTLSSDLRGREGRASRRFVTGWTATHRSATEGQARLPVPITRSWRTGESASGPITTRRG